MIYVKIRTSHAGITLCALRQLLMPVVSPVADTESCRFDHELLCTSAKRRSWCDVFGVGGYRGNLFFWQNNASVHASRSYNHGGNQETKNIAQASLVVIQRRFFEESKGREFLSQCKAGHTRENTVRRQTCSRQRWQDNPSCRLSERGK